MDNRLKEIGLKQTSGDLCLYVHLDSEGEMFLVAVYVDDIILGGKSDVKMSAVKKELSHKFEMKDLGQLHYIFPRSKSHSKSRKWSDMGWTTTTERILQRYGMQDSKPISTPVNPDVKLVTCEKPNDVHNQQLYQSVVGSQLYLSTKTRPDIAYTQ